MPGGSSVCITVYKDNTPGFLPNLLIISTSLRQNEISQPDVWVLASWRGNKVGMVLENKHPFVIMVMRTNLIRMVNETDHSAALCGDRLAKLLPKRRPQP